MFVFLSLVTNYKMLRLSLITNLLNGLDGGLCLNGSRDVIVRFDSRFRHTPTPV